MIVCSFCVLLACIWGSEGTFFLLLFLCPRSFSEKFTSSSGAGGDVYSSWNHWYSLQRQACDKDLEITRRGSRRGHTLSVNDAICYFLFGGIKWGEGMLWDVIKNLRLSSHLLCPSYFIDEEAGIWGCDCPKVMEFLIAEASCNTPWIAVRGGDCLWISDVHIITSQTLLHIQVTVGEDAIKMHILIW